MFAAMISILLSAAAVIPGPDSGPDSGPASGSGQCTRIVHSVDGTESRDLVSIGELARLGIVIGPGPSGGASASSSSRSGGSAHSSVSVSSSSSAGGRSEAVTTQGDGSRSITVRHDAGGCTVEIDERPAQGD